MINQKVQVIILFVISLMLLGCSGKVYKLKLTHQGLIECFRLDREPVTAAACGDDPGNGNLAKPNYGNYRRNVDQPMTSNLLIQNMLQERLDKLPVSNCLWTAGSQYQNGDRLHLLWEGYASLLIDGEEHHSADQANLYSACRFDPAFNRIPVLGEPDEQINNDLCLGGGVLLGVDIEQIKAEQIKSKCDMNPYVLPLVEHVKPIDPYGRCLAYDESGMNLVMGDRVGVDVDRMLTGWNEGVNQASGCAATAGEGLISIKPTRDMILSVGDLPFPGSNIPIPQTRSLLYPQVMTVIDQRDIARPLLISGNNKLSWQGEVLVQGDAGQQKWLENFSENIRVDQVRLFKLINSATDEREYIDLNDATLFVFDPDDGFPGVAGMCSATDGQLFDVTACQIDATPTYRVENLANQSLASLSDPLIWQIELADEQTGDLYIEFHLVSTYQSSEAAILADPAYLDLGDSLVGESSSQLIQVTNVGSGPYMIDFVGIDLNYGQSQAFSAARLDDPVMIPYLFYLEPTGEDDEYTTGVQDLSNLDIQFDIREFESHSTMRSRYLENVELEVESESVMLNGHVAVAQSPNPSFDGSLRHINRIYPFRYPVYQVWDLPYLLKAGEQRSVMVTSQPPYVGEFTGKLNVAGYPLHDPSARSTSSVFLDSYGLTGPLIEILPKSLSFPLLNGGANELSVVVVNAGDAPLIRHGLLITDSSYAMHANEAHNFKITTSPQPSAVNNINAGDSEYIQIKYDPGCFPIVPVDGFHRAVLMIETDVGNRTVPLAGDPARYVANEAACQPGW